MKSQKLILATAVSGAIALGSLTRSTVENAGEEKERYYGVVKADTMTVKPPTAHALALQLWTIRAMHSLSYPRDCVENSLVAV